MAQHGLDCFGALEHVMLQDGAYLGAGDVRIGDFVLLVDCDHARAPRLCPAGHYGAAEEPAGRLHAASDLAHAGAHVRMRLRRVCPV